MAEVTVDVELDEFPNHELIHEVKQRLEQRHYRSLNDAEKQELYSALTNSGKFLPTRNLVDEMKREFIFQNFNKITLEQLEDLVK